MSKIKKINKIKQSSMRYDITVDNFHCYIANNIVVHNTDGQNIMVSWKNNKLIAARNKSHLKNAGENALDKNGIKAMFSGRGEIEDAFYFAMNDLGKAIKAISDKDKEEIFNEGSNFMSLEVIYPATQNVIPYDLSLLIFHGVKKYDVDGKVIGDERGFGNKLAKIIKDVNADVQDEFAIEEMTKVTLAKSKDFDNKISYFLGKLKKIQNKFKLKDSDEVALYHQAWWEEFIESKAKNYKYSIPKDVLKQLIRRWAFSDKSYKVADMKKTIKDEEFLAFAIAFDKKGGDHYKTAKENIKPIEQLFLQLGVEVMSNMESFMAANPDEAVQRIRTAIAKDIKSIRKSGDVQTMQKLQAQLRRIKDLGGFKNIVPSEGLTFHFKGKLYKFTGLFAPVNNLLGLIKFSR
jgi:hypothetical protein